MPAEWAGDLEREIRRLGEEDDDEPPAPTAHDSGPTVREAAAQDRAYWEQRDAGEGT
ncbi:hypothetical protein [Streptomyces sp. NPDC057740]|uniref:hypothetical protein n=1 Tax=Streptomyces sp. NPDC057740 TaxID=3346234 RepID=UPI003690A65D